MAACCLGVTDADDDHQLALNIIASAELLAQALANVGQMAQAVTLYARTIAECRAVLGTTHRHTHTCINNLGVLLLNHTQYPRQPIPFENSTSIFRSLMPPRHTK